MTAVSTASVLGMTKPKLPFSIDVLMRKEDEATYRENSPVRDYSLPKSKPVTGSHGGSPQSVLVPIPTFPASTAASSSRERPSILNSGLYQRTLPHYSPGLDPSLAGMLMQGDPYQTFPWYLHHRPRFLQHRFGPGKLLFIISKCSSAIFLLSL